MVEDKVFNDLFDIIPFSIYVVDVENYEIVYMNKSMLEKIGDCIGRKCYESIYCEEKECYFCKIPELLNGTTKVLDKTTVFEHYNALDDCWYQMQEKCMTWLNGRVVKYSIAVNINELKETQNRLSEAHAQLALKNKELERLSITDMLTQLYNKSKIDSILSSIVEMGKRYNNIFSIIILDIDFFKNVNDTFGHQIGDVVLKEFAHIIRSNVRKIDHVGRWGGEEFLLICPETGKEDAKALAEKLRRIVEEYSFTSIGKLTCSMGIATYESDDDEKSIVDRADIALYNAKNGGRNKVQAI